MDHIIGKWLEPIDNGVNLHFSLMSAVLLLRGHSTSWGIPRVRHIWIYLFVVWLLGHFCAKVLKFVLLLATFVQLIKCIHLKDWPYFWLIIRKWLECGHFYTSTSNVATFVQVPWMWPVLCNWLQAAQLLSNGLNVITCVKWLKWGNVFAGGPNMATFVRNAWIPRVLCKWFGHTLECGQFCANGLNATTFVQMAWMPKHPLCGWKLLCG